MAKAWTSLTENTRQISIAEENCKLAEENLDLNTFSYTEGKLTILDVLSAQLTWIQAYTNLIQSYYEQKIALADYRKATGIRYFYYKKCHNKAGLAIFVSQSALFVFISLCLL